MTNTQNTEGELKMSRVLMLIALVFLTNSASAAFAIDHKNLDENRPLLLQDVYPIAEGEWAFEAGAGLLSRRRNSEQIFFPFQLLYGALPNLQAEIGTTFFTDPHTVDEPHRSGDLSLSVLYNLNQETLAIPGLGIKGTVILPTGVDSAGVDAEIAALITKSFYRLSMHFNAAYEFVSGREDGERPGRYRFVIGPSYPIGAPLHTRTTLLADLFMKQSARDGEGEIIGSEAGFRYQLTERLVVDAGAGSEFSGPGDRSQFYINAGISVVLR
jgi:hypothetical protein